MHLYTIQWQGFVGCLMLGLLMNLGIANAQKQIPGKRPNIIVILADDLGYNDVGYMGSDANATPNIDAIAANGLRFTDAYTTCPVCGPSRAGLLTGRYQNRFGFEDNPGPFRRTEETIPGIPLRETTMGEYFKELGYNTALIGKWHEENVPLRNPSARGFDKFFGFINGASSYYINDNSQGKLLNGLRPVESEEEYLTNAFGREACLFIERNADRNKPFMLYVPFNAPHGPFEVPDEYKSKFSHVKDEKRQTFLAMINCMDENVGKIITTLKNKGIEEETLIVFLSDNGGECERADNTPLRECKGSIYEGGIRVPFCMQWKGVLPANHVVNHPVIALDVLPTAIAATGASVSGEWFLDGVNLLPYLTGEKQGEPHQFLYWRFLWHHAVRKGDWKLVKHRDQTDWELYNLASDISEQTNLSQQHPDKVKELLDIYTDMSDQMLAPQWGWQPDYCGSYNINNIKN
ncbi:sulfatase-like hydrolase/transferase [Carboxylicivirga sediminis]|uniref:Sulfatase-like hydrolase/transferase n=1 Tax=Carboxylicivirga sediminis TaxID=2006564 RepID=A0A941F6X4_9BACT|nr:sulfatase-like hydrolase/transferase [Carboxylicivirga sediminis]MBR8538016.1 sulfatase-like hydrolase/transferase [Carboxylicivirga sediminis]